MSLSTGDCIGPYEIQASLEAGGMGEVYKAHDPTLQRTVAIKVLATQDASSRLLQEARQRHCFSRRRHRGEAPIFMAGLGHVLAASARRAEARELLDRLVARKRDEPVPAYHLALICATLGDNDQAFEWLDQAFQEHSWLPWLRLQPGFAPLHSDARFSELVRRMNLPE